MNRLSESPRRMYDLRQPITVVSLTKEKMIKPDAKSNHSCPDASCPSDRCRVVATENDAKTCIWTCVGTCPYGCKE